MEIKKVGVVGCGLMGHGIAQVSAQSGYDVEVREVDQAALDKGIGKIEKQLGRAVEKGKLEQSAADEVRGRIQGTLDYGDLAGSDLVLEAITEGLDAKREISLVRSSGRTPSAANEGMLASSFSGAPGAWFTRATPTSSGSANVAKASSLLGSSGPTVGQAGSTHATR